MNIVKAVKLESALSAQIVSTADAKTHAVIEHSIDDAYIASLCIAAQKKIQDLSRRQLLTAVYSAYLDLFPEWYFELPYGNCNPINTYTVNGFAAGSQIITPNSMVGISIGTVLKVSQPGNKDEYVTVTAVTSTTFTATFLNDYTNPTITTSFSDAVVGGPVTITPLSMVGVHVNSIINLDDSDNSEYVKVDSITDTTFTTTIVNDYPAGATLTLTPGNARFNSKGVNFIEYYDTDNVLQIVNPEIYNVDIVSEPIRVCLDYKHVWPWTYPKENAIRVNWTCGVPSASMLEPNIILAIKMLVTTWFNKREDTATVEYKVVPHGIRSLVQDNRIEGFGY